jgi:hypothetical protein
MPPRTRSETRDLVSCALCEVIDSIVTPRVRDGILSHALARSAADRLPTDPEQLQDFVSGPLRDALIQAIGLEPVEAVTDDLQRIIGLLVDPGQTRRTLESPAVVPDEPRRRRTSSRPRMPAVSTARTAPAPHPRTATPRPSFRTAPTPRYPASLAPAPPATSAPPISSGRFPRGAAAALSMAGTRSTNPPADVTCPVVIVASQREDLARRLSRSLSGNVDLIVVRGILDLVREIGADTGGRAVLLLDCRSPSVRPVSVAALAEELPPTLRVVLWGASPELRSRLLSVSPRCHSWIGIAQDTSLEDLAGRCAILVC